MTTQLGNTLKIKATDQHPSTTQLIIEKGLAWIAHEALNWNDLRIDVTTLRTFYVAPGGHKDPLSMTTFFGWKALRR